MTTLPSSDLPARSQLGDPVDPRPAPTLSAVPDLRPVEPRVETNTAYPDTAFAKPGSDPDLPAARPPYGDRTAGVNRAAAAIEAAIGGWLALSPWLVGSGGSTVLRWNDVAVGALLALIALAQLARPTLPRTPTLSFGLGAWTIVAAFVLSFQNGNTGTAPLWNAIGCGAALTMAAAWSTAETERAALHRG